MEIWLPVPGYESAYSVSDLGRVKRNSFTPHSRTFKKTKGIMGQHLIVPRRKYRAVRLYGRGTAKAKTVYTHKLVTLAFLGPRPRKMQINHINGDGTDNRLKNLEYTTASKNKLHSHYTLGRQIGETHFSTKLTTENVKEIKALIRLGARMLAIAEQYGMSPGAIYSIKRGQSWKHVTP